MEDHIFPSVLPLLLAHLEGSKIDNLRIAVGVRMVVVYEEDAGLYIDLMVTNPWERAVQIAQALPKGVWFDFNIEGTQPWNYDPDPPIDLIGSYLAGLTGLQEVFVFDVEGSIALAALIACIKADPSACANLKTLEFPFKLCSYESGGDVEEAEKRLKFLKLLKSFLAIRPDIVVRDRVGALGGNEDPGI